MSCTRLVFKIEGLFLAKVCLILVSVWLFWEF